MGHSCRQRNQSLRTLFSVTEQASLVIPEILRKDSSVCIPGKIYPSASFINSYTFLYPNNMVIKQVLFFPQISKSVLYNFAVRWIFPFKNTVITLNIGTPRPATVVVLNIKQFNFTLK